jgi:hypothetical protein
MALLLLLFSSATVGRKLSDIEYQRAAGVNGVDRIQAIINARTHANRVFLALTFLIVSILGFVDLPPEIKIWVARVLFLSMLGFYTTTSVLDWIDERRQVRLLLKEKEDHPEIIWPERIREPRRAPRHRHHRLHGAAGLLLDA